MDGKLKRLLDAVEKADELHLQFINTATERECEAFVELRAAAEAVRQEADCKLTVTADETGVDNERYIRLAHHVQSLLDKLHLTTMGQVFAVCELLCSGTGMIVGHGGHHVWMREGGRNGRGVLIVTSDGPDWR